MNALTKNDGGALAMGEADLLLVLQSSLYPGAALDSIKMVIGYCKAAGLDPMQKPVHIVPMWDGKAGKMRDVVMPGVGLYRTQASRSGECAGVTEPEFGDDVSEAIGGQQITFPAWCRVTVKRRLPTGEVVSFTAKEFWRENYAVKGGKEKSIAPNAMWTKRPYGQIAKCAEAQALRKAFPELGSQPAAEEMEGKQITPDFDAQTHAAAPSAPQVLIDSASLSAQGGVAHYSEFWGSIGKEQRHLLGAMHAGFKAQAEAADKARTIDSEFAEAPSVDDAFVRAMESAEQGAQP